MSNVSSGASYNATENRFELDAPLEPGESYTLSFNLDYSDWCAGNFPAGALVWENEYQDGCGNLFYPPGGLSTLSSDGIDPFAMNVTGPIIVQIGEQYDYTITSAYMGPQSCGNGGTVGEMAVVDTLPAGFTVIEPIPNGGVWDPTVGPTGDGTTGGTVTWVYTPPATLDTTLTVQAPERSDCEIGCFTTPTNTITTQGTDCCGCDLSDTASITTAIECDEGVGSTKEVTPSPGERCRRFTYTNTYVFGASSAVSLNDLVFTERADSEQEFVSGSLAVTLDGSNINSCAQSGLTDTTQDPGGSLVIDFSGCPATTLGDQTLVVAYDLTVSDGVVPCEDSTFYTWSDMDVGANQAGECLVDGIIHEAVEVNVAAPAMALDISGMTDTFDQCESRTITLTLTQLSDGANPRDVILELSGQNYTVVDPGAAVCGGDVAPTSCTPTVVGGNYQWNFGDGFTAAGQNATIQLEISKSCGINGELSATAYYDDNCTDDDTADQLCSVSATQTPALLRSGDILVRKTPEVYYATENQVVWEIYLTNRGSGNAFNVWLDDVLGNGLEYVNAQVDNMDGVTVTPNQDHNGGTINGGTVSIEAMAPGERRQITFTANLVNCTDLTNAVRANWGCDNTDCQNDITDTVTVEVATPNLVNTNNIFPTGVNACSSPRGNIILRNAGQVTTYNQVVNATLPDGLIYVPGTTRWRFNGGAWNGPAAGYDPDPASSPLQWSSAQIPDLAQLMPGDTLEIEFDLSGSCSACAGRHPGD